jgi:hypothetical protein
MLQARVSAEVHKQTQFIPASVKVVQDLGAVLGQKRRDGFELHNDRFVAQEVGAETVLEFSVFVKNRKFDLRFEGNPANAKLDFQCLLIGWFGETTTEFVMHLKASSHDGIGFLLEEHG